MFQIELVLDNSYHSGLNALDLRRRLGLPDQPLLHLRGISGWVSVSEAFARAHFHPDACNMRAAVKLDHLAPGDLEPGFGDGGGCGHVQWAANISDDRVRELFTLAAPGDRTRRPPRV